MLAFAVSLTSNALAPLDLPNATNWERLPLPSEFPAVLRDALVAAATDAGVQPVVRCSHSFVETPMLLSSAGAVVT